MYCSDCGKQLDEASRFCPNCGKPQSMQGGSTGVHIAPTEMTNEPGRGAAVFTLGILSLLFLGPILGIPAWIMGHRDRRRMRNGSMDNAQRGLTTAGMILGMIGTFCSSGLIVILLATAPVIAMNLIDRGNSSRVLAAAAPEVQSDSSPIEYYDGIEEIRGQTADDTPAIYLLRLSLGYDPADKGVRVEIGQRNREIQSAVLKYVSGKTAAQLAPTNYDKLQADLRDLINGLMKTGKVRNITFREFAIVK